LTSCRLPRWYAVDVTYKHHHMPQAVAAHAPLTRWPEEHSLCDLPCSCQLHRPHTTPTLVSNTTRIAPPCSRWWGATHSHLAVQEDLPLLPHRTDVQEPLVEALSGVIDEDAGKQRQLRHWPSLCIKISRRGTVARMRDSPSTALCHTVLARWPPTATGVSRKELVARCGRVSHRVT
jgi:hypothetical protein